MSSTVTIAVRQLRSQLIAVLAAIGASRPSAGLVVDHLLEAERLAVRTHGLTKFMPYVGAALSAEVNPAAVPEIIERSGARVLLDGRRAFGQVGGASAVEHAEEAANGHGVGVVTVKQIGHAGRLGAYTEELARRGKVGIAACSLPPHQHGVVWHGSKSRRLGSNPIAYAFPTTDLPVAADFSTSGASWGRVRRYFERDEELPAGLIVDADGHASTDPHVYFGEPAGGLLPLGGLGLGYKGSALALLVELVTTALAIEDILSAARGYTLTVIAIDPPVGLEASATVIVDYLKSSVPVDIGTDVRVPGHGHRTGRESSDTIVLEASTWENIVEGVAALRLGLNEPDDWSEMCRPSV